MNERPDKSLLSIDLNKLEEECERNPKLALEWGLAFAAAKKKAAEAKNKLKLAFAQIGAEVRANPETYGVSKVTEASVEAAVLMESSYQRLQRELLDAEEEESILQQMVFAISDRKQELENLCNLHGQMYWSRPVTHRADKNAERVEEAAARRVKPKK